VAEVDRQSTVVVIDKAKFSELVYAAVFHTQAGRKRSGFSELQIAGTGKRQVRRECCWLFLVLLFFAHTIASTLSVLCVPKLLKMLSSFLYPEFMQRDAGLTTAALAGVGGHMAAGSVSAAGTAPRPGHRAETGSRDYRHYYPGSQSTDRCHLWEQSLKQEPDGGIVANRGKMPVRRQDTLGSQ